MQMKCIAQLCVDAVHSLTSAKEEPTSIEEHQEQEDEQEEEKKKGRKEKKNNNNDYEDQWIKIKKMS